MPPKFREVVAKQIFAATDAAQRCLAFDFVLPSCPSGTDARQHAAGFYEGVTPQ